MALVQMGRHVSPRINLLDWLAAAFAPRSPSKKTPPRGSETAAFTL